MITKDYTRQQSYHGFPVLDLTRPPSVSQLPASSQDASPGPRYQEALGGERTRDRWAFASAESRPSPVSSAARPALPGCDCLPRHPAGLPLSPRRLPSASPTMASNPFLPPEPTLSPTCREEPPTPASRQSKGNPPPSTAPHLQHIRPMRLHASANRRAGCHTQADHNNLLGQAASGLLVLARSWFTVT